MEGNEKKAILLSMSLQRMAGEHKHNFLVDVEIEKRTNFNRVLSNITYYCHRRGGHAESFGCDQKDVHGGGRCNKK